jgi:hypothetical protein
LALAACGGGDGAGAASAAAPGDAARATVQQAQLEVGPLENKGAPVPANEDSSPVLSRSLVQGAGDRPPPRAIVLPELTAAEMPPQTPSEPLQIGVTRAIPQVADAKAMAGLLSWSTATNGSRRAAISVRSPEASGLRFGLLVEQLPQSALLRVYAPGAAQAEEVTATEVLSTIQANLDAGSRGIDAHTYWLPSVEGDQAVLEIELPAGVDPASLKVSLPRVSHRWFPFGRQETLLRMYHNQAVSCHVDAMCSAAKDSLEVRAVGWMTFMRDGKQHGCSGTLLNDKKSDYTPYFLSANHCIAKSEQNVAATVEIAWFYHTESCGSSKLVSTSTVTGRGAQLLYNSEKTDTAFMLLKFQPPKGAIFAGWNADKPSNLSSSGSPPNILNSNTKFQVYSLHHPKGDKLKYSAGVVDAYTSPFTLACLRGEAVCDPVLKTALSSISLPLYHITWSEGTTETGSSGGALFSSKGQVIGQATAVEIKYDKNKNEEENFCVNSTRPIKASVYFGRFDLAFSEGNLGRWLNAQ